MRKQYRCSRRQDDGKRQFSSRIVAEPLRHLHNWLRVINVAFLSGAPTSSPTESEWGSVPNCTAPFAEKSDTAATCVALDSRCGEWPSMALTRPHTRRICVRERRELMANRRRAAILIEVDASRGTNSPLQLPCDEARWAWHIAYRNSSMTRIYKGVLHERGLLLLLAEMNGNSPMEPPHG